MVAAPAPTLPQPPSLLATLHPASLYALGAIPVCMRRHRGSFLTGVVVPAACTSLLPLSSRRTHTAPTPLPPRPVLHKAHRWAPTGLCSVLCGCGACGVSGFCVCICENLSNRLGAVFLPCRRSQYHVDMARPVSPWPQTMSTYLACRRGPAPCQHAGRVGRDPLSADPQNRVILGKSKTHSFSAIAKSTALCQGTSVRL